MAQGSGAITLALYALEGAVGLPVFANFQAGLFLPTGEIIASGGYIIGFILAAGLVGHLVEKGWGANVFKLCGAMLLGAAIIYVPGMIWLVGWHRVMKGMDAHQPLPLLSATACCHSLSAISSRPSWRPLHSRRLSRFSAAAEFRNWSE